MPDYLEYIGRILGVRPEILRGLDAEMKKRVRVDNVLERVAEKNKEYVASMPSVLGLSQASAADIRMGLREAIYAKEKEFLKFLSTIPGESELDRAAVFARQVARVRKGFFLKKNRAEEILKKRPPENLLAYLKLRDVDELLKKHEVTEAFSALRFMESDEWMHETFDEAYGSFTARDFEERDIEVCALGSEWSEIGKKFIAKKHHNVSHLKEFGVIFLNPVSQGVPGKFLRDFALIFHYLHEIDFYSRMFRRALEGDNFSEHFKSLLRSDVPDKKSVAAGEWLIIQRYLFKSDPSDPRLSLPRVNPESIHWMRGERDLVSYKFPGGAPDFSPWLDRDWVAEIYNDELVSFDLEDNAMSAVSFEEGKTQEFFFYHQREAMWTRIFSEYVGGEESMEKLLMENFDKGIIKF